MRMRAAVLAAAGAAPEVAEVDLEAPRAGEVLVRIAASGLCGSDLNAADGKRRLAPFPVILGHEAAGEVVEAGPGVDELRPGDHVVLSILSACGRCEACRAGRPNWCATAAAAMDAGSLLDGTSRLSLGGRRVSHFLTVSSFAQYAVVPASGTVAIDPAMPLDRAALIGCGVLTGVGAVRNTAGVAPSESVAVFGCGGVGLSVVQAARMAGAAEIVAVDVRAESLELAAALGATHLVDAGAQEPVGAVREHVAGGVEHAFEVAGRPDTLEQAWACLAPRGQLVVIGLPASGARLSLDAAPLLEEKRIAGCYLGSASPRREVPALVEQYLSGALRLDELITRRLPLAELGDALERMRSGSQGRQVVVFEA